MPRRAPEPAPEPAPQAWRYLGSGWLPGVPARDLTADEVAALDPDIRAQALALGLYAPRPAEESE